MSEVCIELACSPLHTAPPAKVSQIIVSNVRHCSSHLYQASQVMHWRRFHLRSLHLRISNGLKRYGTQLCGTDSSITRRLWVHTMIAGMITQNAPLSMLKAMIVVCLSDQHQLAARCSSSIQAGGALCMRFGALRAPDSSIVGQNCPIFAIGASPPSNTPVCIVTTVLFLWRRSAKHYVQVQFGRDAGSHDHWRNYGAVVH